MMKIIFDAMANIGIFFCGLTGIVLVCGAFALLAFNSVYSFIWRKEDREERIHSRSSFWGKAYADRLEILAGSFEGDDRQSANIAIKVAAEYVRKYEEQGSAFYPPQAVEAYDKRIAEVFQGPAIVEIDVSKDLTIPSPWCRCQIVFTGESKHDVAEFAKTCGLHDGESRYAQRAALVERARTLRSEIGARLQAKGTGI